MLRDLSMLQIASFWPLLIVSVSLIFLTLPLPILSHIFASGLLFLCFSSALMPVTAFEVPLFLLHILGP